MKKLKLELDDLRVDTFDTSFATRAKGTVFGEQCTCYTNCTCPGCPSCDDTCANTCQGISCDYTCDQSCIEGTCVNSCHNYPDNVTCTAVGFHCPD